MTDSTNTAQATADNTEKASAPIGPNVQRAGAEAFDATLVIELPGDEPFDDQDERVGEVVTAIRGQGWGHRVTGPHVGPGDSGDSAVHISRYAGQRMRIVICPEIEDTPEDAYGKLREIAETVIAQEGMTMLTLDAKIEDWNGDIEVVTWHGGTLFSNVHGFDALDGAKIDMDVVAAQTVIDMNVIGFLHDNGASERDIELVRLGQRIGNPEGSGLFEKESLRATLRLKD